MLQHVEMEGPARIAELAVERDLTVEVRHLYAGQPVPQAIGEGEMLIVMGGGMGVGDRDDPRYPFLRQELALIEGALAADRAVLGVCLGAQLLACAAGARVYPMVRREPRHGEAGEREIRLREVGWGAVDFLGVETEPALAGLRSRETVLHWHGDTFDLPAGARRLAATEICPNQAFRIGRRAFGLQFHVEVDRETACRWAVEDAEFVRAALGPAGPDQIIAESAMHAAAARAAGDRLIRNLLFCMGGVSAGRGRETADGERAAASIGSTTEI